MDWSAFFASIMIGVPLASGLNLNWILAGILCGGLSLVFSSIMN